MCVCVCVCVCVYTYKCALSTRSPVCCCAQYADLAWLSPLPKLNSLRPHTRTKPLLPNFLTAAEKPKSADLPDITKPLLPNCLTAAARSTRT